MAGTQDKETGKYSDSINKKYLEFEVVEALAASEDTVDDYSVEIRPYQYKSSNFQVIPSAAGSGDTLEFYESNTNAAGEWTLIHTMTFDDGNPKSFSVTDIKFNYLKAKAGVSNTITFKITQFSAQ